MQQLVFYVSSAALDTVMSLDERNGVLNKVGVANHSMSIT